MMKQKVLRVLIVLVVLVAGCMIGTLEGQVTDVFPIQPTIATFVVFLLIFSLMAVWGKIIHWFVSEWRRKNERIEELADEVRLAKNAFESTVESYEKDIGILNSDLARFLYPAMTIAAFKKYYEREDEKEKVRLAMLEAERFAREEKERITREYWASSEGQAELDRREEVRERRAEEEAERRRKQRAAEVAGAVSRRRQDRGVGSS